MSDKFESWAIVDLFGHTKLAGKVTEESIGGCSFIRVDVPEIDNLHPAFTKLLGNGAIYSITPCGEQVARAALKQIRPAALSVYIPSLAKISDQPALPVFDIGEGVAFCDDCGRFVDVCECDCDEAEER